MNIKVTFIGYRNHGETKAAVFLYGKKELCFKKVRHCVIGRVYRAVKEDEKCTISQLPEDLGESDAPKDQIEKWRVEEALAEAILDRKRTAKKMSKINIASDLVQLKKITKGLNFSEKRALIEHIMNKLMRD